MGGPSKADQNAIQKTKAKKTETDVEEQQVYAFKNYASSILPPPGVPPKHPGPRSLLSVPNARCPCSESRAGDAAETCKIRAGGGAPGLQGTAAVAVVVANAAAVNQNSLSPSPQYQRRRDNSS